MELFGLYQKKKRWKCIIEVGFLTGAGIVLDTVAASGNVLLLAPSRDVGERDAVGESVTNLKRSHFVCIGFCFWGKLYM